MSRPKEYLPRISDTAFGTEPFKNERHRHPSEYGAEDSDQGGWIKGLELGDHVPSDQGHEDSDVHRPVRCEIEEICHLLHSQVLPVLIAAHVTFSASVKPTVVLEFAVASAGSSSGRPRAQSLDKEIQTTCERGGHILTRRVDPIREHRVIASPTRR